MTATTISVIALIISIFSPLIAWCTYKLEKKKFKQYRQDERNKVAPNFDVNAYSPLFDAKISIAIRNLGKLAYIERVEVHSPEYAYNTGILPINIGNNEIKYLHFQAKDENETITPRPVDVTITYRDEFYNYYTIKLAHNDKNKYFFEKPVFMEIPPASLKD